MVFSGDKNLFVVSSMSWSSCIFLTSVLAYSSAFYSCLSWCVGGLVAYHFFLRAASI